MNGHETDVNHALKCVLVDRLGSERYQLWIGDHTTISVTGQNVVVEADHSFRIDRLRKLLGRDLREAASQIVGQPVTISYRVVKKCEGAAEPAGPHGAKGGSRRGDSARAAAPNDESPGQPSSSPGPSQRSKAMHPTLRLASADEPPQPPQPRAGRRPFASLGSFFVGACNRVAYRSAEMVVDCPGHISPLVLHGPVGSGKTHLLEGIWSLARRRWPSCRAVYLTSEQFTSLFVEALRGTGLPSFRRKYRDVDLLIIDDLQFLVGKRATIVELVYTVDALSRDGRQLVMAADRPPAELPELGEELLARLASGLVCSLEPLDLEVRRDLIRRWSAERKLSLDEPLVDLIATQTTGDARRIAGILNCLWVTSQALERPIDADMVSQTIGELIPCRSRMIHLSDVQRVVCETFGIEPQRLRSDGKSREVVHPRMLAMWLARKYTRAALSEISQFFGRRSHSTVLSARTKVERWVQEGRQIQAGRQSQDIRDVLSRLERELAAG